MLGTVGVAPAGGEVRSSLVPDRFGGNMDSPQMRAGSTVFLGVNVEGAMFSVGDGHYRQGEGEACGTAVEGAMTTTLIVELVKGGAPAWPRVEDDGHLMAIGSSRPLEDSWRIGNAELVHWVGELYGPAPDGRLPAAVPDHHGADRQRGRRQLQRRRRGRQGAAAPGRRLRRDPRRAAGARPRPALTCPSTKGTLMDLKLLGRRVLVTGGTRGIGRAIVEAFLAEGAVVGFCARDADEVAATEQALHGRGSVTGAVVDVADGEALAAWVDRAAASYGGLDVVVANVSALGIPDTEENWQASLNVDVMHTVRLVRAALPHLETSDNASIIAISSVSGRESDFASGPYGTAKSAIIAYIGGLAMQLAPKGIRANTVSPGNTYFEGGVWSSIEAGDPDFFATALALNPTGRMGTPAEVAAPVVFLASAAASRISGTNLVVDGALTRGVQF